MIKRGLQNQLEELIGYFPAVGIIGPRQVGKTTLAKALVKNIDKECIYLDLEKNSDLLKLEDAELYLSRHLDKCIIIDEVQRKPDLFPLLRSLIDENRQPARFILLGSAAPELIRDSSESLAGRIAYIELPPFNILEVKDIIDQQEHWLRGGSLPGRVSCKGLCRIRSLKPIIYTCIFKMSHFKIIRFCIKIKSCA